MKVTGGTKGTLKVVDIVLNATRSDYIFGPSDIVAVDKVGMRAGAVKLGGVGANFEVASVATVTLQFSKNAAGTFLVNVARNDETFLRASTAGAIDFAIGQDVSITVRNSAAPVKKRSKSR